MTTLANLSARVLLAHNLRKCFWLGDVLFVAASADHRRVRQLRHYGSRILNMLGKWPVARFAVHTRVFTGFLHFHNVGVAIRTSLVAGIGDRLRGLLRQRISTEVAVFSKAFGNKMCAHQQKYREHNNTDYRQPDKMFGVFKFAHMHPNQFRSRSSKEQP